MAIEWYSTAAAPTVQQSDYKVVKNSIIITSSGLEKFGEGTSVVKLGYDADRKLIGIVPADAGDKTAFKLARRGRSAENQQISAKKLFERFNISPLAEPTSGNFESEDGVLFASLASTSAPKRRRRTKAEMAAAAAEAAAE